VRTEQKNKGMHGEKHLARVQARIHAAGDHLVEITLASGAPWRRALNWRASCVKTKKEKKTSQK